jgi:hypothetical protein
MAFLPGRKVVTRSPHRRVGYISCPWFQDEQIEYESLLEQGFIRIALLCPDLVRIKDQPFKLVLPGGLHYTPDLLLTFADSTQLVVEVKPNVHVPRHIDKLTAAREILRERGYHFLVCTERDIDRGERRNRAARILRQAISTTARQHADAVRSWVPKLNFPISLSTLAEKTGLAPHELLGAIGRKALALRPDLSLDHIYSCRSFEEMRDVSSSYSAWLSPQD